MPSPKALKELSTTLRAIGQKLGAGSSFRYEIHDDHVWLERLLVPTRARGTGTAVMAKILAATDKAGLKVALLADPTDRLEDPTTFDLVRWYGRFGFAMLSATEDGVAMERQVRPRACPPEELERLARAAKANDISVEEFDRFVEASREKAPVRASSPGFR